MPEPPADLRLEIAHVLFIDIVGYSKLFLNEQHELLQKLNQIVRETETFRRTDETKLIRVPAGDGMALVFFTTPEAPLRCAVEISEALRTHPELKVRMGIHSGPVSGLTDVADRSNVAGAGINIAQRVMDCGDAGHILLSRRVAEDLEQYQQWRPHMHDIGECEVKHAVQVHLFNFYTDELGNSELPEKLKDQRKAKVGATSFFTPFKIATAAVLLVGVLASVLFLSSRQQKAASRHAPTTGVSTLGANEKSMAVLPFADLSQARDQEYFCDGISEEILNALAKVEGLRVAARTSSFSFKGKDADVREVAKKLNVENVLEGSLRREGNRIRISAQLISARDGLNLWSETYERELQGVFALQDEITRAIVNALKIKLAVALPARGQSDTEAYDSYLKGRFYWNKRTPDSLNKAIEYFKQAIEKEPNNALAYSGLADCYSSLGFFFDAGTLSPNESKLKAKAAAMKALELDDSLAEAHTSLAFIKLHYDWDWPGAEKEFKRALELNPNYDNGHHWFSHYWIAMGEAAESLFESQRALELDRLGLVVNTHLGWHYFYTHEYDKAIEQLRNTIEMDSAFGIAHWYLGLAYEQKAMYGDAMAEFEKAKNLLRENAGVIADMGHTFALLGQREQAQKVVDELNELAKHRYVNSYEIALIYAGLGEKDQAFKYLDDAYKERSDSLVYIRAEPRLDTLRNDPRFSALLNRIGFH